MSVVTIGMIALFLAGMIVFGMLLVDLAMRQRKALRELRKVRLDSQRNLSAGPQSESYRRPPCQ